jgi:hypothetical protein
MGLFRRKDERAIPKPGTPEFEEAVQGTALPDQQSVSMGDAGWTDPGPESDQPDQAADEQQTGAEEQDDESDSPRRTERVLGALGRSVLKPPNTDGFGGGISTPKQKPKDED